MFLRCTVLSLITQEVKGLVKHLSLQVVVNLLTPTGHVMH